MSPNQIPRSNKDSYPYLVFPTKHKHFFCRPYSKCRPRTRTIPQLRYREILSSSSFCGNYWHLIYDYSSKPIDLLLWNQTTSDIITLPRLREKYIDLGSSILWLAKGLVLLCHSTDQYLIFCKFDINNNDACDRSWTVMHYGETMRQLFGDGHPDLDKLLQNLFFYNDELYAVYNYSDDIVIIKADVHGELSFEPSHLTMPPNDKIGSLVHTYVLESLGDLITIYITMGGVRENEIIDVGVYKSDFESKDWNRASLKDRVIFLGSSPSLSHLTNIIDKEGGGRVFFTRFGDRSLYSFNIEDESLTITLPCPNLPNLWDPPNWLPTDQAHNDIDYEKEDEEEEEEEKDQKKVKKEKEDDEHEDYDYHDDELDKDEDDSVSISMCKAIEYPIIVVEEEKGEKINLITKLDPDIVGEIVRKFAFIDCLNFRAVSNGCRLAAPLTNLPKPQTQLSLPPWSILSSGRTIYILVDPTSNEKYCMKIPEHLVNTKIRYSRDGWLLMSNISSSRMFFYNPFTKDTIRLPDLAREFIDFPTFCFLSSSSTFSDWVCVAVSSTSITYIKSGEEEWRDVEIETELNFEPNHNTPVVLFDNEGHGCFYFLGRYGNLRVLRLDENHRNGVKWEVVENPKTPCHWKSYESNFLIECGGELVSVFVGEIGKWVRVFKLNHIQMVWERVKDLGDYMLFIGRYSCLSQLATIPTMANRIYFPKFLQDDRVVYYSLRTKKFHYSELGIGMASQGDDPAAFFDSFYSESIKGPLQSGWLTPRFS